MIITLLKNNKGITLVALVVTIIVLIILAGVSINLLTGQEGIFQSSQQATEEYKKKAGQETIELKVSEIDMNSLMTNGKKATLQEIADALCGDESGDIAAVYLESGKPLQISPLNVGDSTSIYVQLNSCPNCEFEINRDLKVKKLKNITAENYGDRVNYSVTIEVAEGKKITLGDRKNEDGTLNENDYWKIFYKNPNTNEVVIMYNDYLPNATNIAANAGLFTVRTYNVNLNDRANLINKLTTPSNWESLLKGDQINLKGKATAKGAVDLETWEKSRDERGYTGNNDRLYFLPKDDINICYGYWLSSPCTEDNYRMMCIRYDGIDKYNCSDTSNGIVPVIYLSTDVVIEQDESGVWIIK